MKKTLIALVVALAGLLSIYVFIGLERVWEFTSGNPDMGPVNFKTLKKTPKPNQYLLCPADYCTETPDTISSTYEISASKLFTELLLLIEEDDAKLNSLTTDGNELTLRFLSRAPILRFPDTTNIKVIAISETQSTFAIYAQAKIGQSDLGANRIRIDAMIEKLEARVKVPN